MLSRWFLLVLACRLAGALPATYDQRQTGDVNVQVHVKDVQVLALLDTELLDDYTEYDYIYDYADFTLKPMKPSSTTTEASSEPSSEPSSEATEKIEVTETVDSSTESSTALPASSEPSAASSEPSAASSEPSAASSEPSAASPASGDAELLSQVDSEGTNETSSTPLTEKPGDSGGETSTPKTRINDKTRKVFEDIEDDLKERNIRGWSAESTTKKVPRKRCRTGYSPDGKGRCRRLSQRRLSLIPLAMRFGPKLLDDLALNTKDLAQKEVHRLHSD